MDYSSLWDARIFLDLFLGGLGVGLFLFLAFAAWGKNNKSFLTLKVGAIASFALVALGALCLVSELGRPFNIASTVIGFNATSITSWGGVLQMAFLLMDAIICIMLFTLKESASRSIAFKVVGVLGIGLASLVLVYHGLVLNSVGRGLWANALITPLFMASSILAGGALAIALDKFAKGDLSAQCAKFIAGASLCVATLILAFGFTVAPAGADASFCYSAMMEQSGAIWWLCAFAIGSLAPLALSIVALAKPATWNLPLISTIAACALVGSFALKFIIASAAQIVIGS